MERIEHKIKYGKHIHEEPKSIVSKAIGHKSIFKEFEEENKMRKKHE